jgi:hypothetical protein
MVVDHAITCVNVPIGSGVVSSRYGIWENGDLIDFVYEYESAKMIVESRKEYWADYDG